MKMISDCLERDLRIRLLCALDKRPYYWEICNLFSNLQAVCLK